MDDTIQLTDLAKDVMIGLTSHPKYLNSKYFYDAKGSEIFRQIMRMPEYYLTDCEEEIIREQKHQIFQAFSINSKPFDIVELGAGDGMKTRILLEHILNHKDNFSYIPVDISGKAVNTLVNDLKVAMPQLRVVGKTGDYFKMMEELSRIDKTCKILLFLGSNIGNFPREKTIDFLKELRGVMNPADKLFIGFDLKKDPEVILKAYNDPHGYTASFNLNLLRRINDELNADFELLKFKHHEVYDPQTGTAKSYLISQEKQLVNIRSLEMVIQFEQWEPVFMEMSQKFDAQMIHELANDTGFEVETDFTDKRSYFINSLWTLKP